MRKISGSFTNIPSLTQFKITHVLYEKVTRCVTDYFELQENKIYHVKFCKMQLKKFLVGDVRIKYLYQQGRCFKSNDLIYHKEEVEIEQHIINKERRG